MADGVVSMRFTGNATDLERAVAVLEKQYESLNRKIADGGSVARKAAAIKRDADKQAALEAKLTEKMQAQRNAQLTSWATSLGTVAVGYGSISAAVSYLSSQHSQMLKDAKEYSNEIDKQRRALANLAGFNSIKSKATQVELQQVALNNSAEIDSANKAAMGLSSVGMKPEELVKGADFILKLQSAQGDLGQDPQQLVEDAAKLLAARGLDVNLKNLESELKPIHLLSKPTTLKISDLSQIAPKSGVLHDAIGDKYQENALEALAIQYAEASKSTTSAQAIMTRLVASRTNNEQVKALAQLQMPDPETGQMRSMKPEDVDFVGENMMTVFDRIGKATEKMNAAERGSFYAQFFGQDHMSVAQSIIRDRGRINELVAAQKDTNAFDEDVNRFQSGSDALARRTKTERDIRKIEVAQEHGQRVDVIDRVYAMNERDYGTEGVKWMVGRLQNDARYGAATMLNMMGAKDWALSTMVGRGGMLGGGGDQRIIDALSTTQNYLGNEEIAGFSDSAYYEQMKKQAGLMEQQNTLVQQQTQKLDELNKTIKNAIPQPPAAQPQRPPVKRPVPAGVDRE